MIQLGKIQGPMNGVRHMAELRAGFRAHDASWYS